MSVKKSQYEKGDYPESFKTGADQLQSVIGYRFKKSEYIYTALTHTSYSNEKKGQSWQPRHNERLEFLGDSVLSVVVSRYIFTSLPNSFEGDLTKIRAASVCEDALYLYAQKIELGKYLLVGKGEERMGGRERKSILADAFEAVIAAIYLDSSMSRVTEYVMGFVKDKIDEILSEGSLNDYKSTLQQIVQASHGDLLEYVLTDQSGPPHARVFTVKVMLNSNELGTGTGKTKREAEQRAAREALKLFGQ